MRKIALFIMTLMMVFGLSAVFAKPVVLENDSYYLIADDENKQKDFSGMSDSEIVATIVSAVPKKTDECKNKYVTFSISEVNNLMEKYVNFFAYSKDKTHFIVFQNLGDGRQLAVYYELVSESTN